MMGIAPMELVVILAILSSCGVVAAAILAAVYFIVRSQNRRPPA